MRAQIIFWMLRATDGHAKNFSLFLLGESRHRLTPFYDVLSAWPVIGEGSHRLPERKVKLSMCLRGKNRHYQMYDVQRRHFISTAALSGIGEKEAGEIIDELIDLTPRVADAVGAALVTPAEVRTGEAILRGLRESASRLAVKHL